MTAEAPLIRRLQPRGPRGLRVRVHLDPPDPEEPMEVALEAVERMNLGIGDPLPPNVRHHLLAADADVRVRESALNLLSYRARTRLELRRKLLGKGFRAARIDACLDRLQDRGLLDDAAVAAAFVRDRLHHKPRGTARLNSELRAKGVSGDVAQRVVGEVLTDAGVTDTSLARDVAEGWLNRQGPAALRALASSERGAESQKARRRLHGYLARRGFRGASLSEGMEVARAAARARVAEEDATTLD